MGYTTTFSHVTPDQEGELGIHALDLAKIAQANHPVPLSFVVKTSLFDSFLDAGGLRGRVKDAFERHPQTIDGCARAYKEVRSLFWGVRFADDLREELLEAYRSLAIRRTGAGELVDGQEEPVVMLVPSFTYALHPERVVGVQRNVRGAQAFLDALKECWLAAFLPELVMERQYYRQESFGMAVIVQQQLSGDGSAESSYTRDADPSLVVRSYAGLLDTEDEVTKDEYAVAADPLRVLRSEVRHQSFKLVPEDASGAVTQFGMGEHGARPALTDKQALEVARLTKRVHVALESNVRAFFSVKGEVATLLFVLRRNEQLTQEISEPDVPEQSGDGYVPVDEVPSAPVPDAFGEGDARVEVVDEAGGGQTSSSFILSVMERLEAAVARRYRELRGDDDVSFVGMVESLHDAGALPVPRDDINLLVRARLHVVNGEEPRDFFVGVAWRVNQSLR
ncbi:hypothetical protein GF367_00115 [Candidatus Woesearchaeota archaeon]|nr:hypothetical protein [Candidatus Woesearchaeota archaeon]